MVSLPQVLGPMLGQAPSCPVGDNGDRMEAQRPLYQSVASREGVGLEVESRQGFELGLDRFFEKRVRVRSFFWSNESRSGIQTRERRTGGNCLIVRVRGRVRVRVKVRAKVKIRAKDSGEDKTNACGGDRAQGLLQGFIRGNDRGRTSVKVKARARARCHPCGVPV